MTRAGVRPREIAKRWHLTKRGERIKEKWRKNKEKGTLPRSPSCRERAYTWYLFAGAKKMTPSGKETKPNMMVPVGFSRAGE